MFSRGSLKTLPKNLKKSARTPSFYSRRGLGKSARGGSLAETVPIFAEYLHTFHSLQAVTDHHPPTPHIKRK